MRLLQQLFSSSKTIEVQGGSAPTPAVKSQEKADSRFHGRFKIKTRIVVYWEDIEGNTQKVRARGVDFSRAGARIESPEPMRPGDHVFIQAPELKLMGSAIVRHCKARGFKYRVGLEFPNPLTKSY
ncbi:MAG: hypothetical protein DMG57_11325 [Acidobacteria bacterium]|nr:MAG: hypothetical protein DMG57_11325 [Acidobacteriota bacterium]